MLNVCVAAYLNVLQLGFYSRAVFGCLNGLALHLTQHAVNILQFSLWTKNKNMNHWQGHTITQHWIVNPWPSIKMDGDHSDSSQKESLYLFLAPSKIFTCTFENFSASSSLWRSLSECLSCSSWTWASAFFLRCSDSPLPCIRVCSSMDSSFLSDSRACLALSTDALFCRQTVKL